ncbi:hypothetical protein [Nocardia sp. NPDC051570]|uniref:hypothetical protein n=1 Tax=Nocardia sp. NPDC051570 TaxID=3364324 RepID=UPI0037A737FA
MTHIGGALATAGAILVLAFGGAASASADPSIASPEAHGVFSYTDHGGRQELRDPRNHECYRIEGHGRAKNDTNRVAELFRNGDCRGEANDALAPGERDRDVDFRSVRFVD